MASKNANEISPIPAETVQSKEKGNYENVYFFVLKHVYGQNVKPYIHFYIAFQIFLAYCY